MKQPKKIDANDLKKAVMLILDLRYGATRSKRVRDQLLGKEPPQDRPFQKGAKALNELLRFGRTVSATVALGILDDADKQRSVLAGEAAEGLSAEDERRKYLADYMRGLRRRKSLAVQIENIRRGQRMTEDEKTEFLKEAVRRWDIRRDKFVSEHPEMPYDDARIHFTNELVKELETKLERAKQTGSIKAESTSIKRGLPDRREPQPDWKRTLNEFRKRK